MAKTTKIPKDTTLRVLISVTVIFVTCFFICLPKIVNYKRTLQQRDDFLFQQIVFALQDKAVVEQFFVALQFVEKLFFA